MAGYSEVAPLPATHALDWSCDFLVSDPLNKLSTDPLGTDLFPSCDGVGFFFFTCMYMYRVLKRLRHVAMGAEFLF